MTQIPLTQLGPEAFKRDPQYVTAEQYREFLKWFEREFRIPHPTPTPKERE